GLAELESQHIVPLSARKSDSPIRSSSAAGTFGGSPFLVLTAVVVVMSGYQALRPYIGNLSHTECVAKPLYCSHKMHLCGSTIGSTADL
ncbi:MAG: hypothetical protein ACI9PP_001968, partial [Halobacteriales archaeon]